MKTEIKTDTPTSIFGPVWGENEAPNDDIRVPNELVPVALRNKGTLVYALRDVATVTLIGGGVTTALNGAFLIRNPEKQTYLNVMVAVVIGLVLYGTTFFLQEMANRQARQYNKELRALADMKVEVAKKVD